MDNYIGPQQEFEHNHPFQLELFHSMSNKDKDCENSKVIPEQLNTDKPQPSHVVLQHLQKVAEHFENYANKLLKAINPHDRHDSKSTDNLNSPKCPFMRVATAVGFKYSKADNTTADESEKRSATKA